MYRLIGRLDKTSSMLQLCPSSAILLIEETNKSPFILSYYDRRQYIKPLGIMLKYKKKNYSMKPHGINGMAMALRWHCHVKSFPPIFGAHITLILKMVNI